MVEGLYRLFLSEERYPINLGNPVEMSIREFAEYICRLTGVPFKAEYKPLPADDPKKRRPNISKARKSLGWEPHVSLEDGLRKTIEYFRPRMTFI
jgi:dTDP-glucose 4,6-dehydratase